MRRLLPGLLCVLALGCADRGFVAESGFGSNSNTDSEPDPDADPEAICADTPEGMACVPEGFFTRGCPPAEVLEALDLDPCDEERYPVEELFVSSFAIDILEVTELEYRACLDAGACSGFGDWDYCTSGKDWYEDDLPVDCISWYGARDYCEFVGKRLPTETEWEKAARGDDRRVYPWGDEPASCDLAIYYDTDFDAHDWGCGLNRAWQPGSRPLGASPYGVLDMSGNVEEWVADVYAGDTDEQRVVRGGRSIDPDEDIVVYRRWGDAADHNNAAGQGFRCAVTLGGSGG